MKYPRLIVTFETLVKAIITTATIYGWQVVKSWITGEVDPSIIEVVITFIIGYMISVAVIRKWKNR